MHVQDGFGELGQVNVSGLSFRDHLSLLDDAMVIEAPVPDGGDLLEGRGVSTRHFVDKEVLEIGNASSISNLAR